jgi:hypothetical protein
MVSLLWPPPVPTIRQTPKALAGAALLGLIVGPPIAVFLHAVNGAAHATGNGPLAGGWRLVWSGPAYAVVFYLMCAVPAQYVRCAMKVQSALLCVALTTATAATGGLLAFAVVGWLMDDRRVEGWTTATYLDALTMLALVTGISVWRRYATEKALASARAQWRALQSQISPHFFFNTLNTIAALIPTDPEAAQHTIACLADMSRYAFASMDRSRVPLGEKLQFARAYLEIEREDLACDSVSNFPKLETRKVSNYHP